MSFEDLKNRAAHIGASAEDLSKQIAGASSALSSQAQNMMAIGRGKQSAEQASNQAQVAARSLAESAATLLALKRAADDFIRDAS
jgi:chemotaxis receptor (MCP) glutamine deamidase CheD